ncbi:MAG: hypothetical protein GY867_10710 [bacterium]|nr:hypothetical protein [bacterium]
MSFTVRDCALITRMAGVDTALNLRELRERLLSCPVECLFHHFCETVIRPTFDDPEFRNDFAVWAARDLQDRVLAERLGIINPYDYTDLEELRQLAVEVIDDRLSEVPYIPWVKMGNDFRFMRAVTVVFDTGLKLDSPDDFVTALSDLSLGSIYYHYVEARRRTDNHTDDFTAWLSEFGKTSEGLIEALAGIDFYFISLKDLRTQLVRATAPFRKETILG